MAAQQYVEGDKVRLKEGGPTMVVDRSNASFAACLLLTETGLQQKLVPHAKLVSADDLPQDDTLTFTER